MVTDGLSIDQQALQQLDRLIAERDHVLLRIAALEGLIAASPESNVGVGSGVVGTALGTNASPRRIIIQTNGLAKTPR